MPKKIWIALGVELLVFAVLLFGAAGTLWWPAGWVFLVLFIGGGTHISRELARDDPALLDERMKFTWQKDQPVWDKIFLVVAVGFFGGWLVLMGLDAARFGWSSMPLLLQLAGGGGVLLGLGICQRALQENPFLAAVVRIQTERRHRVVSSGPYAVVRHPFYTGSLVYMVATALLLGSWWGLAAALAFIPVLVLRMFLEERELGLHLAGYADYAARVRCRLLPGIW